MRKGILIPALLIALLAQPALSTISARAAGEAFDPLVQAGLLFPAGDGSLLASPPETARFAAPTNLPGQPGSAFWSRDMAEGTLRGPTVFALDAEVKLPAVAVPPASLLFTATLRKGTQDLATSQQGPMLAQPGPLKLTFTFDVKDALFKQGEGLVLDLRLETPSLGGTLPTVEYLLGNTTTLHYAFRVASLDALGHRHAAGDQHFLTKDYRVRLGDLGQGVWGLDLSLGPATKGHAFTYDIPANASRVRFQMYVTEDIPDPLPQMTLDLPGGPTTVYRGEVVVRDIPAAQLQGASVRCTSCGEAPTSIAQFHASAPSPGRGSDGEPLTSTGIGGTVSSGASGGVSASEPQDLDAIVALAVPALLMLGGVMLYAIRKELEADERRASVPAPAPASPPAPKSGAERGQGAPRQAGAAKPATPRPAPKMLTGTKPVTKPVAKPAGSTSPPRRAQFR